MAKKIEARGALDIAKRALQTCGQIFRYAIALGYVQHNPAAAIRPSDVLKSRRKENYPRVEPKELPELLRKMAVYDGSPLTRAALQLIALTFVRTSELIHAPWDEFDLEAAEWRIPAERMKMRSPHIVPLSRQAVDALRCLNALRSLSPYVFPGERDHERPMSNNTILKALERLGYKHRMTGHGFRGSVYAPSRDELSHPHIELQLAHQERNAVAASYNHATHLPERRLMIGVRVDPAILISLCVAAQTGPWWRR
ncbi:MAG: site-specific integrase [Pseudomonadota bacterium]|nr:site-specific integrase [Pseudomonadota bacterium]